MKNDKLQQKVYQAEERAWSLWRPCVLSCIAGVAHCLLRPLLISYQIRSQPQWQTIGVVFPVTQDLCYRRLMLSCLGILIWDIQQNFIFFCAWTSVCLTHVS